MRILVAEDDEVSRLILHSHLKKAGHEVLLAEDGVQAWRLFEESDAVDVVISDWMMPRLDGLELCRRVRESEGDEYTYFILLSALGDSHLIEGIDAGADDYLTKPLDQHELRARLKSAERVTSLHRRLADQKAELERLAIQLREQSRTDPLTSLGNRLRLQEDLETLSGMVERYGHDYCLVLCDIDRFKAYNDDYGHQAGDEALRRVAHTIADHCRAGDSAYRYGGEEFLVVLPEQSLLKGKTFAERLRSSVESLGVVHEDNPPTGVVTVSIGVAALPRGEQGTTVEQLLFEADRALYRAKSAGRNGVAVPSDRDDC